MLFGLAFALDCLFGDPPNRFHPVCWAGWWASKIEPIARTCIGSGFLAGAVAALAVILPVVFAAGGFAWSAVQYGGTVPGIVAAAIVLYFSFAPKGLAEHAMRVFSALENGRPDDAKAALGRMVGRDVEPLDGEQVVMAAVESVAENFTDGVAASIFFAALGYAAAGPVGAAAAVALHRSANTLDAMWGKKNERYLRFGTFAARLDDALNFVPARLAWILVAVTAMALPGYRGADALRIGFRDADKHESPNSAWTEATFAGALRLRLGGPCSYQGRIVPHPFIGDGGDPARPEHIRKAVRLMFAATILFLCAAIPALSIVGFLQIGVYQLG
jgi:adenosylcobinamide-phosphate synthase